MENAKGKTYSEIYEIAKKSSYNELLSFNEHLKIAKELEHFKTIFASFVTSKAKYVFHGVLGISNSLLIMTFLDFYRFDYIFLNQMFSRNYGCRRTDFSNVDETNDLMKPFYKNINYIYKDNYPASTKMVLKSSSSLNFHINCHFIKRELFYDYNIKQQVKYKMATIYDTINGGTIKNDKGTIIANWAEVPTTYMNVIIEFKVNKPT